VAAFAALAIAGTGASAKTFHVTTAKDSGKGSLRRTVQLADRRPNADRVVIGPRVHRDIRLHRGLSIEHSVTIQGPGTGGPGLYAVTPPDEPHAGYAAIGFSGKGRRNPRLVVRDLALDSVAIYARDRVLIEDVASTARPHPGDPYDLITAIGVYGKGAKTIRDASIGPGWHDGISASGHAEIVDSEVTGAERSGILFDHADGTVLSSSISGNDGSGVVSTLGHADVIESTIADNAGHGILAGYYGGVTLERATVSGNSSASGAGVWVDGYGSAVIINSTVSGNVAAGSDEHVGLGGALWAGEDADIRITASTITGNQADRGGGLYIHRFGSGNPAIVESSIIAGNQATDGPECFSVFDYPPDGLPQPESHGGNVFGAAGCGTTDPGDVLTADPGLGPLGDNGGPTRTHALLPGSPAIGAGLDVGLATDQRGVARDDADSGSFEFEGAP
jgi:hypothetical protein